MSHQQLEALEVLPAPDLQLAALAVAMFPAVVRRPVTQAQPTVVQLQTAGERSRTLAVPTAAGTVAPVPVEVQPGETLAREPSKVNSSTVPQDTEVTQALVTQTMQGVVVL